MSISIPLLLAGVSVLISITALVLSIMARKRLEYVGALNTHLNSFLGVERMVAETPSILEFHGISQSDLNNTGISSNELAYLLNNFTAGGMYFRVNRKRLNCAFDPSSYRYRMLLSDKTRKGWPLVKQMMAAGPYRDKIDLTIEEIEKQIAQSRK
jgi:hypothetical protein